MVFIFIDALCTISSLPPKEVPSMASSVSENNEKSQGSMSEVKINLATFSYSRAFDDEPRNFEPLSNDEDDT
ncbi:hypothetical protein TNCV_1225281 [Trichonephila clavipes]|nr:hypothetical protein TNCV_1225281 [Trichonephila clavipes]